MAYSSIGHVGFALVGLAAGNDEGVQGVLIYMAIYLAMTLGTFACILTMRRKARLRGGHLGAGRPRQDQSRRRLRDGDADVLARRHSAARWLLGQVVRLPRRGESRLWPLAIIGVIASVVGGYYYLRIVKVMFFDDAKEGFLPVQGRSASSWRSRALFVLFYVVYPAPLVDAATVAAKALR